jgi:hypothetical protein
MAITAPLPRSDGHPWPMNRNPDPEVRERPTRRRFSASYQLAILDADAAAIVPGAKGASSAGRACPARMSPNGAACGRQTRTC